MANRSIYLVTSILSVKHNTATHRLPVITFPGNNPCLTESNNLSIIFAQ